MSKTPETSRTSHSGENLILKDRKDKIKIDKISMADKTSSIYNPGVAVYDE